MREDGIALYSVDEQYAKITCARGTTQAGIETADIEFYVKDGGTDTKVLTIKND